MGEYNLSEDEKKMLRWLVLAAYHSNSNIVFSDDIEFACKELGLSKDRLENLDALCEKYDFVDKTPEGCYRLDFEIIGEHGKELLVREETSQLEKRMHKR